MFSHIRQFRWKGRKPDGMVDEGIVTRNNKRQVLEWLQLQNIVPILIIPLKHKSKRISGGISGKEIAIFSRQLATTLSTGLDIIVGLDLIMQSATNKTFQEIVKIILAEVKAGNQLGKTLRLFPRYFDDVYCNLVMTGELSGTLDVMFEKLADFQEKRQSLNSKVKKSTYYPIAVLSISIVVTVVLLTFVIPQFQDIYGSMDASLPWFTQLIIDTSDWLKHYGLAIVILLSISIYFLFYLRKRSRIIKYWVDKGALKIPIIGLVSHKASTIRFCRTLSTTYAAGTPLVSALDASALSCGNECYKQQAMIIKQEVVNGQNLYAAFSQCPLFTPLSKQMIKVGENTGALGDMLEKIADIHEDELNDFIDGLSSVIEPIMISLLSIIIGSLVIAMYLPIFNMGAII